MAHSVTRGVRSPGSDRMALSVMRGVNQHVFDSGSAREACCESSLVVMMAGSANKEEIWDEVY